MLIQAVTARFKTEKGFLEARKSTAAIIAPRQRRRGVEETAVAVIRTADDEGNPDSLFIVIETQDAFVAIASCLCVQSKARQPRTGNLKRVSAE